MGNKKKVGKQRRDKAYWAAKEIGYRSRASFKLVQLNRKWEFLQKSNVCIDLCAAPGSWMQVCRENMPISSLVVGVDISPIKPMPSCIALQEDITTEKCRQSLKKELKTAKADLVLHDGAPNVGKNWIHDAYSQNVLVLAAFKLATAFLSKGGWFVTKVFRSKDYQSLMWVFGQFFKKVHATKPPASRNESAEIFVVCQFYLAPDKIDPKFLDPKDVFSDLAIDERKLTHDLINPEKANKKPSQQGYADGVTLLFKEAKASEFIMGEDPIRILNCANAISLDTPRIKNHPKTTKELKECLKDLKVLAMKDLRKIKKWRDILKEEFEKEAQSGEKKDEDKVVEKTEEQIEDEELEELDKQVAQLQDQERRKEKRLKKKEKKEKDKQAMRTNLKMDIAGDRGPMAEEHGLFKMSTVRTNKDLNDILDKKPDQLAVDSDDEQEKEKKIKVQKFERETGHLSADGNWYEEHDDVISDSSDDNDDDVDEHLGLKPDSDEDDVVDEKVNDEDPNKDNPLLTNLSQESQEQRRARKAEQWFKKIGDLDDESDLEDAEMEKAVEKVHKSGGTLNKKQKASAQESGYTSDGSDDEDETTIKTASEDQSKSQDHQKQDESSSDESSSDDDDSEMDTDEEATSLKVDAAGFEIIPQKPIPQQNKKKRKTLSAEQLTIGEQMIYSKKAKRDLMDSAWNRYMFDDEGLPDWFVQDEKNHYKKQVELDPKTLKKYQDREQEMNVKTIKKVVEAKARRKKRVQLKLAKAKKKAAALLDNEDIGSHEKAKEIKKMYKSAQVEARRKKDVKYVVAKKFQAGKKMARPAGTKGPYKVVDPRMKKDNQKKRGNASGKKNQKRRLKGKHAKPTKQFNTNR